MINVYETSDIRSYRFAWYLIGSISSTLLNNQKSNLRFYTRGENQMNRQKQGNVSSIYKGVSFSKDHKKWRARIRIKDNIIHLGYFISETDAAIAYNAKAIELFCEFANLNIIN